MTTLEISGVTVTFGGLRALDDVSLSVGPSEPVGLIGPNGAGKSTLLSVLSGLRRPNVGRVVFDGTDITRVPSHRRAAMGMSRTFQRLELWGSLTVEENIRTAAEFAQRWKRDLDPARTTTRLLRELGLTEFASELGDSLPSGIGRVVEVARALASEPSLLLLDEPSAGLDSHESRQLGKVLRAAADAGSSLVLVEHHMEMVMSTCRHIWVLDFGRVIANGTPELIQANPDVQRAYLGAKHVPDA